MAVVRPFRGIRYNSDRVGEMSKVMCPPYDVVNEAERARLVSLSPWNLIRVELPQEKPSVPATDADYANAAKTLATWEKEGILVRDERACLYPYLQSYTGPDGKRRQRHGFLCALRVEDYDGGAVRPHEKTLPKPKEDRFKLLTATSTNVSPVFGLYDDKEGRVSEVMAKAVGGKPIAEFTDGAGIEHRVWRVDDVDAIGAVISALTQSRIYIADGHHRYETAIRYRNARREPLATKPTLGTAGFDYALAYLADVRDPGLAVFPIHRLAKVPAGMDATALKNALARFYSVEPIPGVDPAASAETLAPQLEAALGKDTARRSEKVFVVYSKTLNLAWTLRSNDGLQTFLKDAGVPKPVAALDVTALHRSILEETLHASYAEGTVHFAHSIEDAVTIAQGKGTGAGDKDAFDLAILLHPTKVTELLTVVDAGETMPQKSTFFYPKPATGIVMNRIDD